MKVNLQTPGLIQVELNPDESFIAKSGSLSAYDNEIQHIAANMSLQERAKSILSGEPFTAPVMHRNAGNGPRSFSLQYGKTTAMVGMPPPEPTKIVPVKLTEMPGPVICERKVFLAASEGVELQFWESPIRWFSLLGLGRPYKLMLKGNGVIFMEVHQSHIVEEERLNLGMSGTYNPAEMLWFSTSSPNFGPAPTFFTLLERIKNPRFAVNGPARVTRFRVTTTKVVFDMGYYAMLSVFWMLVFSAIGRIF